jgi:hypothetical protein
MKAKLIGISECKNEDFYILSFDKEVYIAQRNVFVNNYYDDDLVIGEKYEIGENLLLVLSKNDFFSFEKGIVEAVTNLLRFEREDQAQSNEKND